MVVVAVVLAVAVGVSLGLLGGGGSILAVPLLVYVAGLDAKEAIATSLLVVGATSSVGVIPHARAGRVRWRTGLLFGIAGMAGAYGGGRIAEFVPGTVLLVAFAVMMLATATAMIRGRRDVSPVAAHADIPVLHVIAEGAAVGLATGLVGAGGGFLVVPALVLLGGMPMAAAVGTSLLVIAMKSFAGLAGYLATVEIDWVIAGAFTGAAVAGTFLGAHWAGTIPQQTLRRAFGWFVVAMGVFVLARQVPTPLWGNPITWAGLALGAMVAAAVVAVRRRAHRRRPSVGRRPSVPTDRYRAQRTPRDRAAEGLHGVHRGVAQW